MNIDDSSVQSVAALLQQTLSPGQRKEAEQQLSSVERLHNFSIVLLKLVAHPQADHQVKFAASVFFKNFVKNYWKLDAEETVIPADNKSAIKSAIVDLMITVSPIIQLQLSEAVSIIADHDFPQKWDTLIQELVNKLSPTDFQTNNGVLQTAHSIFKRWRGQFRTDRLFSEIKLVLEHFCDPYLRLFQATDAAIDANLNNPDILAKLLQTMWLLCKIFHSLICQDLPEFIEDHDDQFMALLHKYLNFKSACLPSDPEEAGILEKVKTSICEIIDTYAKRYEDDFPKLPIFVESVWTLLVGTSLEAKNDLLVSKAIGFLTSVVKPARHKALFSNADILNQICQNIVLPNMTLRESDEELFEDDPIEFIRRDLEGSDTDTRRRAAADLVRGLLEQFGKEVTEIFGNYVNAYLTEYDKNKSEHWKSKDTALYLLMNLSAKGVVAQAGATQLNEFVALGDVFTNHIMPDLSSPVNGGTHPIIKIDVIKYVLMFRSQIPNLPSLLPLLIQHLSSGNYVVYTYASICIEKCLSTRAGDGYVFSSQDVKPHAQNILSQLFQILAKSANTPQKLAENDYLMKTILRVLSFNKEETKPFAETVLVKLCEIVDAISKNPSNPKFNYFTFEALSAIVRFVPGKDPAYLPQFEQRLTPLIMAILQKDIAEFTPYALQLLSQLLALNQEQGIPQTYQAMLPSFLQGAPWENHGNIPGLVKLMKAYVLKGSAFIAQSNQIPPFLGICQKLISSRMTDQYGFELLSAIFEHMPAQQLGPFQKSIFTLLLSRLYSSKTSKFSQGFLRFISFIFAMRKPGLEAESIIATFNAIQPNLFKDILGAIVIPEIPELAVPEDRRLCVVGLSTLVVTANSIKTDPAICTNLMSALVHAAIAGSLNTSTVITDETYLQDAEEAGYQTGFVKLAAVEGLDVDYTKNFPDSKTVLQEAVVGCGVFNGLPADCQKFLQ